jgi:hypothetical protein
MSNLARRTMRASVAVAGIAAAGLGLAAPAVASPTLPIPPRSDEPDSAPTALDTELVSRVLGELDALPTGLADLPMPFQFDAPSMHTDGVQFEVQPVPLQQLGGELSTSQGDTGDTSER